MSRGEERLLKAENQAFLRRAEAILLDSLRRKLETGEHGTVAISLDVGDGAIRGLEETSRRWWRSEPALGKY